MIRWLLRLWLDRPDKAARVTGYTFRPGLETYDESKAVAGYYKSQRQTESGRPIPQPKAQAPRLRQVK